MKELLEIRNLKITTLRGKESVRLLDSVDLNIPKKCSFGIVGESGCGKSITASAILGLLPYPLRVSEGSIRYESRNGEMELLKLSKKEMQAIRGGEISMIFQDPMTSLDPIFTVEAQMEEAVHFHHPDAGKREARERSLEMLRKVNIPRPEQTLASYPHQLSGGQLQRIMIAIALINHPRLLLADEPTTALDVTIQAQVLDLIRALRDEQGSSMLLITHDLGIVAENCDKVAVMYAGEIVESGTVEEVFTDPRHPYTVGLFGALPSMNEDSEYLQHIHGLPPDPGNLPSGCKFSPRCPYATKACHHTKMENQLISGEHYCLCTRADEIAAEKEN
mgnify:CR=1 FL=1